MNVSENERKIENLRKDHETWGAKLHELQISDKDQQKQEAQKGKGLAEEGRITFLSPEIEMLDKDI